MGAVYRLTLRQLSGKWRLAIMTVLAAMPVVIAIADAAIRQRAVGAGVRDGDAERDAGGFDRAAGGARDRGGRVRQRGRGSDAGEPHAVARCRAGRSPCRSCSATITIAAPFIAAERVPHELRRVPRRRDARRSRSRCRRVVGVALYASAFVWLGLVTHAGDRRRACSTSCSGKGFFSGFVSGVRLLSIRHYAIALMHGLDPRRFASAHDLSFGVAIAMAVLVFGGFLLAAVRRLRAMDVP